jgi:phenylacetic acid degradation operon negative regulatory protein
MPKKDLTFSSKVLMFLLAAYDLSVDFVSFRETLIGIHRKRDNGAYVMLNRLYQKGWIKFVNKNGERFLKLTQHGQIEALLAKARMARPQKWDGKWRVVVFDIPEDAKDKRSLLRGLLKRNGFLKLQASVYISPYPVNREAIRYLQETDLMNYIRIGRLEELDNDQDIKKKFGLVSVNKK